MPGGKRSARSNHYCKTRLRICRTLSEYALPKETVLKAEQQARQSKVQIGSQDCAEHDAGYKKRLDEVPKIKIKSWFF